MVSHSRSTQPALDLTTCRFSPQTADTGAGSGEVEEEEPLSGEQDAGARSEAGAEDAAPSEQEKRDALGQAYLEIYGIENPRRPKEAEDPHGGQDPRTFAFDASLARTHVPLAVGLGLGIASAVYSFGTSAVVLYDTLAMEVLEAVSGVLGFISYGLGHRHLLGQSYPAEAAKQNQPGLTPGYAHGLGHLMLPSVLAAGMGFSLYESHAVGCMGAFIVTSVVFGAIHLARHGSFRRE